MVLILDGKSEIGAHVRSNLCYLSCLRHLIRSRAVINHIFFLRKDLFSFMRAQNVLSYHLIYVPCLARKEFRINNFQILKKIISYQKEKNKIIII